MLKKKKVVQSTFDTDDDFLKACLEDPNVEVNEEPEEDVEGIGAVSGGVSKYSPRLTAPSKENKNWIHYSKGGFNYCILIKGNSCLPNCVGYAWGRWRELLGKKHRLSLNNAEVWYLNKSDGYKRGSKPKVGAVVCWRKGVAGNSVDGAGHVAIVEQVHSDGSITTSNSGYGGSRFWTARYKYPYNIGSAYHFQGFIYNPNNYSSSSAPSAPAVKVTSTVRRNTNNNQIQVKVSDLNVRKGAGTSYSRIGYASKGYYNYSATKKANGYTWYKIANNQWVAYNKSWFTVLPKKTVSKPASSGGFKVGDTVTIIGKGNSKADGKGVTCYGKGWKRKIKKIYSGQKFPYLIGNDSGNTGYYPAKSLKK